MGKILTKTELAQELKSSERTIDRLRKSGMPTIKKGNYVRFELEKVLEWLRKGE